MNNGNNFDKRNSNASAHTSNRHGSSRSLKSTGSSWSLKDSSAHNHSIHRNNYDLEVGGSDEDSNSSHGEEWNHITVENADASLRDIQDLEQGTDETPSVEPSDNSLH